MLFSRLKFLSHQPKKSLKFALNYIPIIVEKIGPAVYEILADAETQILRIVTLSLLAPKLESRLPFLEDSSAALSGDNESRRPPRGASSCPGLDRIIIETNCTVISISLLYSISNCKKGHIQPLGKSKVGYKSSLGLKPTNTHFEK